MTVNLIRSDSLYTGVPCYTGQLVEIEAVSALTVG